MQHVFEVGEHSLTFCQLSGSAVVLHVEKRDLLRLESHAGALKWGRDVPFLKGRFVQVESCGLQKQCATMHNWTIGWLFLTCAAGKIAIHRPISIDFIF